MCANFGDPRSRDRELRYKKIIKNGNFWLQKLLNRLQFQKHLTCKAEIWTQCVCTYKCFMQTKFEGARSRDQILQAKNGPKVDDFEPIYLGTHRY